MPPRSRIAPLLAASLLFAASTASAQTVAIESIESTAGGRRTETEPLSRGVNAADCASGDAIITFRLTGITTNSVNVWHDDASGSDCEATAGRTPEIDRTCAVVGTYTVTAGASGQVSLELPLADVTAGDPSRDDLGQNICDRQNNYTLYFFDSTSDMVTGEATAASFTIIIDGSPPPAPTITSSAELRGSSPTIEWDALADGPTTTQAQMRYRVYVDTDGCDPFSVDGGTGGTDAGMTEPSIILYK